MSLLTLSQVMERTGKAKSTIYRDSGLGTFPKSRKDGARTVWLSAEIEEWELSLPHADPKMGQSMGARLHAKKKPLKSAA